MIAFVQAGTGIWAVIKHEIIETPRTSDLETIFALAITDEKGIWDKMQTKVSNLLLMHEIVNYSDLISSWIPTAALLRHRWTRGLQDNWISTLVMLRHNVSGESEHHRRSLYDDICKRMCSSSDKPDQFDTPSRFLTRSMLRPVTGKCRLGCMR